MANKITQGHIDYLNQGIKATNLNSAFKDAELDGIDILDISNLDTSLCTNFDSCFENSNISFNSLKAFLDMKNALSIKNMFKNFTGSGFVYVYNFPENLDKSEISPPGPDHYGKILSYYPYNYEDRKYGPMPNENMVAILSDYTDDYVEQYMHTRNDGIEYVEDYLGVLAYLNSGIKVSNLYFAFEYFGLSDNVIEAINENCPGLDILNLTNLNTSECTDMSNAFNTCLMSKIDISTWNTSSCTTMKGMFYQSNIKTIDISHFIMDNVTNIEAMFSRSKVNNVKLPNIDNSKVTSLDSLFCFNKDIETIDFSNFNVDKIISMCNMFEECSFLETLNIPNWNTNKVTDMSKMFFKCSNLKTINGIFDLSSCTNCSDMFWACNSLTGVHLKNVPRSLDLSQIGGTEGETYIIDNYID